MNDVIFRAGYLPGLSPEEVQWRPLTLGAPGQSCVVEVPQLSAAQMGAMAERVKQATRLHLKPVPVSEIVRVLDAAIARLLDQHDPYRQTLETLLPITSGFDTEMVRLGLASYLRTFRALQLHRFVAEDFSNPKILDEFQPRTKGGWSKALGPDLLVHVWAGNVPGLPLWSFVSGLLVKAGNIGKIASAEPVFASIFARLLAEIEPRWSECFAVVWWPGGDEAIERGIFGTADTVLAYGSNATLRSIQERLPATARFLPHGHKLSLAVVSASALSLRRGQAVARQAALDVARYDQQGCYSPHVIYVQRGAPVQPVEFAQYLASELAALTPKMSRRALSLEEAASVGAWRESHEFLSLKTPSHQVLGDAAQACAVVYTDTLLPLGPGPLNRCVLVIGVDSLEAVLPLLEPQRAYLQTVGIAASPEELLPWSELLALAGVTRVCALGAMTSPEAGWHHDGRFSLLDLVRMVDVDQSAESAAEGFTRYES